MPDDTAYVTMLLLNPWVVKNFLNKNVVIDSKHPYTKNILKHNDIVKVLELLSFDA